MDVNPAPYVPLNNEQMTNSQVINTPLTSAPMTTEMPLTQSTMTSPPLPMANAPMADKPTTSEAMANQPMTSPPVIAPMISNTLTAIAPMTSTQMGSPQMPNAQMPTTSIFDAQLPDAQLMHAQMTQNTPMYDGLDQLVDVGLDEDDLSAAGGRWSQEEDDRLKQVVQQHGAKNWKLISKVAFNGSRTDVQCLHRWQKVLKPGLVKGPWTKDEDRVIQSLIETYGIGNIKWSEIAAALPGRLGKQCRERWVNHLDPNLKKSPWTEMEDRTLMEKQLILGNKWRDIAAFLPGRSENSVKNRWNSARRKKKRSDAAQAAVDFKTLRDSSIGLDMTSLYPIKETSKKRAIANKNTAPKKNKMSDQVTPMSVHTSQALINLSGMVGQPHHTMYGGIGNLGSLSTNPHYSGLGVSRDDKSQSGGMSFGSSGGGYNGGLLSPIESAAQMMMDVGTHAHYSMHDFSPSSVSPTKSKSVSTKKKKSSRKSKSGGVKVKSKATKKRSSGNDAPGANKRTKKSKLQKEEEQFLQQQQMQLQVQMQQHALMMQQQTQYQNMGQAQAMYNTLMGGVGAGNMNNSYASNNSNSTNNMNQLQSFSSMSNLLSAPVSNNGSPRHPGPGLGNIIRGMNSHDMQSQFSQNMIMGGLGGGGLSPSCMYGMNGAGGNPGVGGVGVSDHMAMMLQGSHQMLGQTMNAPPGMSATSARSTMTPSTSTSKASCRKNKSGGTPRSNTKRKAGETAPRKVNTPKNSQVVRKTMNTPYNNVAATEIPLFISSSPKPRKITPQKENTKSASKAKATEVEKSFAGAAETGGAGAAGFGLEIVGNGLSEKQKKLLREDANANAERNNLHMNHVAQQQHMRSLQSMNGGAPGMVKEQMLPSSRFNDGFEVLGMRTLDNLPIGNSEHENEAFELFTFDDFVDDPWGPSNSSGRNDHKNKEGTTTNNNNNSQRISNADNNTDPTSSSPTTSGIGMTTKDLSATFRALGSSPNQMGEFSTRAESHQGGEVPAGALHPRPLSPNTVSSLIGNMAHVG